MSATLAASIKWGFAVAATMATAVIAYEATTIPFLRGAGLAQADFELFVVLMVLGLPALAVISVVAIVCWRREGPGASLTAWVFKNPLGILWAGNIAVQGAAWLLLVYIRTYGLHAVRI